MRKIILLVAIAVGGWQWFYKSQIEASAIGDVTGSEYVTAQSSPEAQRTNAESYRCDGRTHCSQMTSCAEATYFLRNCPGVKMDGNNDGVPCEQQWFGRREQIRRQTRMALS